MCSSFHRDEIGALMSVQLLPTNQNALEEAKIPTKQLSRLFKCKADRLSTKQACSESEGLIVE